MLGTALRQYGIHRVALITVIIGRTGKLFLFPNKNAAGAVGAELREFFGDIIRFVRVVFYIEKHLFQE